MELGGALNEAEIQNWYDETYGKPEEGEELTGSQKVKRFEAAKAAREALNKMKVDSGEPDSVRKNRQAEVQLQKSTQFWGDVVAKTIVNKEKQTFSVNVGKNEAGEEMSLAVDFTIPPEIRQLMQDQGTKFASLNRLGRTNEDHAKVAQFCQRVMWANCGPEILSAAVRNAKSNATEAVVRDQHNIKPLGESGGKKVLSPAEKTNRQKAIASMKKSGPF